MVTLHRINNHQKTKTKFERFNYNNIKELKIR